MKEFNGLLIVQRKEKTNDFIHGFFYPFKCIKLFFKYPKLILYSVVPVIINLIIYGTIFFYTYNWIIGKSNDALGFSNSSGIMLELITSFIKIFLFLLVLVICYFAFVIFGGIISAPFNEKISAYVEEKIFNEKIEAASGFFKDFWLSIREELKKILFYFSVIIPLLVINFIPMIGSTITFVFGSLFSFFYNALDFLDYPLTRRLIKFRSKLKIVGSQRSLSFGFGAIAFLLNFLPVVNVLFRPLLVVAGTSLFYEKNYLQKIS